jgi:hypothetical protein
MVRSLIPERSSIPSRSLTPFSSGHARDPVVGAILRREIGEFAGLSTVERSYTIEAPPQQMSNGEGTKLEEGADRCSQTKHCSRS